MMQDRPIRLVPYDSSWPLFFYEERKWLLSFLPNALGVYHVGSTAIERILAKPIIDILVEVESFTFIDSQTEIFKLHGYEVLGEFGIQGRRYFRRMLSYPQLEEFHLHIYEKNHPEIERTLAFCRYLQAHEEDAQRYNQLKKQLAQQFTQQRVRYTEGKTAYIRLIDQQAIKWQNELQKLTPLMEENVLLAKTYFTKCTSQSHYLHFKGAHVIQSEQEGSQWNYVYGAKLQSEKDLEQICQLYQQNGKAFSFWVCPWDQPKNLALLLETKGFLLKCVEEAMILDLSLINIDMDKDFAIRKVTCEEDLQAFDQIQLEVEDKNQTIYEQTLRNLSFETLGLDSKLEFYLGITKQKAVCCGVLIQTKTMVGIYSIRTKPQERNKGYVTAFVKSLIEEACKLQSSFVFLQASLQSKNIYQRLGFKRFSSFFEYI